MIEEFVLPPVLCTISHISGDSRPPCPLAPFSFVRTPGRMSGAPGAPSLRDAVAALRVLTVADMRACLANLQLPRQGTKAVLHARLFEAM